VDDDDGSQDGDDDEDNDDNDDEDIDDSSLNSEELGDKEGRRETTSHPPPPGMPPHPAFSIHCGLLGMQGNHRGLLERQQIPPGCYISDAPHSDYVPGTGGSGRYNHKLSYTCDPRQHLPTTGNYSVLSGGGEKHSVVGVSSCAQRLHELAARQSTAYTPSPPSGAVITTGGVATGAAKTSAENGRDDETYTCCRCTRKFHQQSALVLHMSEVHAKQPRARVHGVSVQPARASVSSQFSHERDSVSAVDSTETSEGEDDDENFDDVGSQRRETGNFFSFFQRII